MKQLTAEAAARCSCCQGVEVASFSRCPVANRPKILIDLAFEVSVLKKTANVKKLRILKKLRMLKNCGCSRTLSEWLYGVWAPAVR